MEGSTRLAGCTGECVPIIVCSDGRKVFMAEGGTRAGRGRWGRVYDVNCHLYCAQTCFAIELYFYLWRCIRVFLHNYVLGNETFAILSIWTLSYAGAAGIEMFDEQGWPKIALCKAGLAFLRHC